MNDMQTGDEWLVRPDIPNYDVFTSVRNEAQLDGLEDYELLTQLGAKDPEAAKQVAGQLIRSATLYTREGAAATAAHKTLLDLLTGEAAEPIAVELFRDDFANGYDYAWDRDGTAGTQWSVRDGRYTYSGAGTNATAMSTLHSQTLRDGRIDFTVKLGDAMNGDQSMWAGLCFRKANAADTAFQSGYTLCIRKKRRPAALPRQPVEGAVGRLGRSRYAGSSPAVRIHERRAHPRLEREPPPDRRRGHGRRGACGRISQPGRDRYSGGVLRFPAQQLSRRGNALREQRSYA